MYTRSSSRMEQPPPVPVTQPKVQNFAHSEGIRLAGWLGSSEVMRASPVGRCCSAAISLVSLGPGNVISKFNLVSISGQPRRKSEVVGGCGGLSIAACEARGNEMISRSKHN
jgi:hypothetical protein